MYLVLLLLNKDKPVVSKMGKILSWRPSNFHKFLGLHYFPFLFGGALLCEVSGVLFLNSRLSSYTCVFLQFLSCFGPTLMFSAILVKTRKIYTIFTKSLMDSRDSRLDFGDLCTFHKCPSLEDKFEQLCKEHSKGRQFFLMSVLIFVQFIIVVAWSGLHPQR